MAETLGFERYLIHGGDWGATIASWIACDAPEAVMALHLNSAVLRQPLEGLELDEEERVYLDVRAGKLASEGAYQAIQATKPQTLSYGLTDSPAGLAAWIVEKFHGWVVPGSEDPPPFPIDMLLTNIMIYWLNGINAANWMYCALVDGVATTLPNGRRVTVPTALFQGDRDLALPPPEQWILRSYDLVERQMRLGMGHFPSIESAAGVQIAHMREFFGKYRRRAPAG
jgi:microsomal epoxide hydrolase